MGYVYRYMRGKEWVYVGKASRSVKDRVEAHKKEEKFFPYLKDCSISYCEFQNNSDMDAAELALIKIFKPILNEKDKTETIFPFFVDENKLVWNDYYPTYHSSGSKVLHAKPYEPCVDMLFAYTNADKLKCWYKAYHVLARVSSMNQVFGCLDKHIDCTLHHSHEVVYTLCPFPRFVEETYFVACMKNANVLWKKDIALAIYMDSKPMWDIDYIKEKTKYFSEEMLEKASLREACCREVIGDYDIDYLYDCHCFISREKPTIAKPEVLMKI